MTLCPGADNVSAMASYEESLRITCELLHRRMDIVKDVRPSDHIQRDLGLDSLAVMEFAADVENRFAINIPTEMLETLSTVEDVARAIVRLVGAQQSPRHP
jgi:acyl carrier protein